MVKISAEKKVNVYLVINDKYGIGHYTYGNIYFNKKWALIESYRNMSIDIDNGLVDSKSDVRVFHMAFKNDRYWLFVSNDYDIISEILYESSEDAEKVRQRHIDNGFNITLSKSCYIIEKKIMNEKPIAYMDMVRKND